MKPALLQPRTWLFIVAGILGIFGEVCFTALQSIWRTKRLRLMGHTFLWMFPIYGSIAILYEPLHHAIATWHWLFRGTAYMVVIYAVEYVTGALLKMVLREPVWQYTGKYQLNGHIRLGHAPVWFAVGLFIEGYFHRCVVLSEWLSRNFGG